jgi:TRAP-type C4-dicarboxylate transport system permease small subunit
MPRLMDFFASLDRHVALLAFCIMQSCVTLQVFSRYVLNIPLSWPEEVARYCLVWLTFMGASAAVRANDHIRIDALLVAVPPRLRVAMMLFTNICAVATLILVTPAGFQLVRMMIGIPTAALEISMAWVYLPVPLSFTFMIAQLIYASLAEARRAQEEA